MLDDLRAQFLPEFIVETRSRLQAALSLVATAGPGGDERMQSISTLMHSIAGEAMLIGAPELALVARAAGGAARRYLETNNDQALVACARALRSVSRAVDTLAVPAQADITAPTAQAAAASSQRIRVMVVDDSPINAALLREGLAGAGFDTTTVGDNFDLIIDQLQKRKPQVLLVDWLMPGCDTRRLCRQIQSMSEFSQLRVLLVTSLPTAEAEAHARALRVEGAVSKEQGIPSIIKRVRALSEPSA